MSIYLPSTEQRIKIQINNAVQILYKFLSRCKVEFFRSRIFSLGCNTQFCHNGPLKTQSQHSFRNLQSRKYIINVKTYLVIFDSTMCTDSDIYIHIQVFHTQYIFSLYTMIVASILLLLYTTSL